jgi:TPR repeat protein
MKLPKFINFNKYLKIGMLLVFICATSAKSQTPEFNQLWKDDFKTRVKKAEDGNVHAQEFLATLYLHGGMEGVKQDYKEAYKWCRMAAEQGSSFGEYSLGTMYAQGQGVQKDEEEAFKWFKKAGVHGSINAQINLAYMYDMGKGTEKDYKEAIKLYQKVAENKDDVPLAAKAQRSLGRMYLFGQGVDENVSKAIEWYEKASKNGDADAPCDLGVIYSEGRGVDKDRTKAMKWFRLAAERGNVEAKEIIREQN